LCDVPDCWYYNIYHYACFLFFVFNYYVLHLCCDFSICV
jgi:hypothetical protein